MARKLTLQFLKTEAASGVVLGFAALAAMVVANSPWSADYFAWLKSTHILQIGPIVHNLTISEWIKEGLMAVFFLVVGLEIKYEILRGELSDPRKLATPVLAALGGMIGPAVVFLGVARVLGAPTQGWPIPLATDIAFALAVFAVVAKSLPTSLRIFLLTLAIVDDLGAIALIAVLFSGGVAWSMAPVILLVLGVGGAWARLMRVPAPFWVLGFLVAMHLSLTASLPTSLTAVAFAAIVPVKPRREDRQSPLKEAMQDLHPYVAFLVLPVFAFAKAGVSFQGLALGQLASPLVLAIAIGLAMGKPIGVLAAAKLTSVLGVGRAPTGATWMQLLGVAMLCGVGFTMSLFLGTLTFPGAADSIAQVQVKLGVLLGSVASATVGGFILLRESARCKDMPVVDVNTDLRRTNIDLT